MNDVLAELRDPERAWNLYSTATPNVMQRAADEISTLRSKLDSQRNEDRTAFLAAMDSRDRRAELLVRQIKDLESRLHSALEIAQCAQRMTDTAEVTEAIDKLIDVVRGSVVERTSKKRHCFDHGCPVCGGAAGM